MTIRWVTRRKLELLRDIDEGRITEADACARYALSVEELAEWRSKSRAFGERGMRVTRTQEYRTGKA